MLKSWYPGHLSLGNVVRIMQNLLMEQVPVRDYLTMLEAMADWAPAVKQLDQLTEHVRQALSRSITKQYLDSEGQLIALSLGQSAEHRIAENIQHTDQGNYLAINPRTAQRLMQKIASQLDGFAPYGTQPLLLCSAQIRIHLKKMADRFIPNLVVLSYEEITPSITIQSIGVVELTDED